MTLQQDRQLDRNASASACRALSIPIGRDGQIAGDLLVCFEPHEGHLADATRADIQRWARHWLATHPGAIVVMGCNGKARNSVKRTRLARLRTLSRALAESGVSEDRVRYTDDVLELTGAEPLIAPDRGTACVKVLRACVIESAVMPIRELFSSATPAAPLASAGGF